jgi:tRNA-splicing endonuclease subunit sen54 N-term
MGRNGDVRKKSRANNMGQQWWRKLTLPRRGKKETLLAPAGPLPQPLVAKLEKRTAKLRKAVEAPRTTRAKHLAVADWDPARAMARVVTPRGNVLQSMGLYVGGVQYLFPEEAVYLCDRAQLDLRVDGVPASLQRAWGLMLEGQNAVTLDEYCAFAHLRRVGFVVRRPGVDSISDIAEALVDDMDGGGGCRKEEEVDMLRPPVDSAEDGDYAKDDVEAQPSLKIAFAVWRVGAYKRKETHRPLFNLVVWRYEDAPPRHAQVRALLEGCVGKTRLRAALLDRGVVVLVDIANNATPLSSRYINRLPIASPWPDRRTLDDRGTMLAAMIDGP